MSKGLPVRRNASAIFRISVLAFRPRASVRCDLTAFLTVCGNCQVINLVRQGDEQGTDVLLLVAYVFKRIIALCPDDSINLGIGGRFFSVVSQKSDIGEGFEEPVKNEVLLLFGLLFGRFMPLFCGYIAGLEYSRRSASPSSPCSRSQARNCSIVIS